MQLFVAGIGTDVGKTVASAVLVEALAADYWKPIQAGFADGDDSQSIRQLIANPKTKIWPERHRLARPASPHFAAEAENIAIQRTDFQLPTTENLIVEAAGGLLVPINRHDLVIDLAAQLRLPVVLVCAHYLGAINHTLLSVEALRARGLPILGLVFNGENYNDNEEIILHYTQCPCLFRLPTAAPLNKDWVAQQAAKIDITAWL